MELSPINFDHLSPLATKPVAYVDVPPQSYSAPSGKSVSDEDMLRAFSDWLKTKGLKNTEQCLFKELENAVAATKVEPVEQPPTELEVIECTLDDVDTWDGPDDLGFTRTAARPGDEFYELWQEDVARHYFNTHGVMPAFEDNESPPGDDAYRQYCAQFSSQFAAYALQYDATAAQLQIAQQQNQLQRPGQDQAAYQYQLQQYEYLQQQQLQMVAMQQEQQHHYLEKKHADQHQIKQNTPYIEQFVPEDHQTSAELTVTTVVGPNGAVTLEHYPNPKPGKPIRDPEYDSFELKVVYEVGRTGFEEQKDFPIKTGTIIAGRYQIQEYLGSAAFSRAIQCLDLKTGQLVCIKIIRNSKDFFDQSLDEIKLLQYIRSKGDPDEMCVLQLYDHFYYKEHLFLVCELLRDNLYEFSKYTRESGDTPYFTIPRLQKVTLQVLTALQFIHNLQLIHCDLKPENILLKSYSRCEVKVIDFGSSCFTSDHLSSYVQSRCYRSPEVVLGLPYTSKIDMWSLGCILAELFTGKVIFHNDSVSTMLARIVAICGSVPDKMLRKAKYCHRFYSRRGVLYEKNPKTGQLNYLHPKRTTLRHRLQTDDELFIKFVDDLLQISPEKRISASEALNHPFLKHDYGPLN